MHNCVNNIIIVLSISSIIANYCYYYYAAILLLLGFSIIFITILQFSLVFPAYSEFSTLTWKCCCWSWFLSYFWWNIFTLNEFKLAIKSADERQRWSNSNNEFQFIGHEDEPHERAIHCKTTKNGHKNISFVCGKSNFVCSFLHFQNKKIFT